MRYLVAAVALAPFLGVLIGMLTRRIEVKPCCPAQPPAQRPAEESDRSGPVRRA